jgi:para-aminobenzoate synthetase component 1
VDLLRNDLSMVADDVKVDKFQYIDFIKTQQKDLYAMSSEISGSVKPEFNGKGGKHYENTSSCRFYFRSSQTENFGNHS